MNPLLPQTLSFAPLAAADIPPAAVALPLLSAVGYVVAVLMMKRASAHGVGLWRTAFVSNVAMGLVFSALWLLGGQPVDPALLWQPAVFAALFLAGQIFTFAAMAGDVSLATPVLGLKIIFVAGASTLLLAETVRPAWWIAAALATAAVGLLQSSPRGTPATAAPSAGPRGQSPRLTVLHAALAAASFAVSDVLVQRHAPAWGTGRFLPLGFGLVALFSLGLVPFFQAPLRTVPRAGWRWLAPGSLILAAQAAGMGYTMATHGRATAANILYSTRGLWSVLAVGLLGAWLGTAGEQKLPRAVFVRRLAGSGLMLAAVALVLG